MLTRAVLFTPHGWLTKIPVHHARALPLLPPATCRLRPCLPKGLFLAPTIVGESLKGAFLLAEVFGGSFGLPTNPPPPPPPTPSVDGAVAPDGGPTARPAVAGAASKGVNGGRGGVGGRTDIVQALELGDRERLVRFCEAVQLFSPVNAYVRPGVSVR